MKFDENGPANVFKCGINVNFAGNALETKEKKRSVRSEKKYNITAKFAGFLHMSCRLDLLSKFTFPIIFYICLYL